MPDEGPAWSPTDMTTTDTTPSLYERIGGAAAIRAAVEILFDKILADPELMPYFTEVRIDRHMAHLCDFIGGAIGGPEIYRGRDIAAAHRRQAISAAEFGAVAGHLIAALNELGVDPAIIDELIGVVAT